MSRPFVYFLLFGVGIIAGCSDQSGANAVASANPAVVQPEARPCPSPDANNACAADTAQLAVDFGKAMAGDYHAQRNTAWALSGASPYIIAQPVQACAWRKVILATRPADAGYTDASQAELDCARLSEDERADADLVAQAITAQIG